MNAKQKATNRRLLAAVVLLGLHLTFNAAFAQIPLDDGFTYQGQLKLAGAVVNDSADFEFTLWDADVEGNIIGSVVALSDVTIADGLFTVKLNFGVAAFNGDARWLEIDVRSPAGGGDFTTLSPRQPLTANPYALQTRGLFVDDEGNVGIGTTSPNAKLDVVGETELNGHLSVNSSADIAGTVSMRSKLIVGPNVLRVDAANRMVGIGTQIPSAALDVVGPTELNGNLEVAGLTELGGNLGVVGSTGLNGNLDVMGSTELHRNLLVNFNTLTVDNTVVGIGTRSPIGSKLDVEGPVRTNDSDLWLRQGTDRANGLGWYGSSKPFDGLVDGPVLYGNTGGSLATKDGVDQRVLTWNSYGNVGIGTLVPTRGKLDISGSQQFDLGPYGFLLHNGTTGTFDYGFADYSLYASNRIAGSEFNAHSDARIKNILGRSNRQQDLNTLLSIEITDYTMVDVVTKGPERSKKVIGQQVAEVFPQAVTISTDVVPDIYQLADVNDGWIMLATDLAVGDRVRLITEENTELFEVLEVRADGFRVEEQPQTEKVFVFGREVDDFHNVDYEEIAMLNVSATQELHQNTQELHREIVRLTEENVSLRSRLDRLDSLEERLAAIESSNTRVEFASTGLKSTEQPTSDASSTN